MCTSITAHTPPFHTFISLLSPSQLPLSGFSTANTGPHAHGSATPLTCMFDPLFDPLFVPLFVPLQDMFDHYSKGLGYLDPSSTLFDLLMDILPQVTKGDLYFFQVTVWPDHFMMA